MSELSMWATTVRIVWPEGRVEDVLICVEATTLSQARDASGLMFEDFHLASEDELDAWESKADVELKRSEVNALISLVSRDIRRTGRKRQKEGDASPAALSTKRLRWMNETRAKLDLLVADMEDDREGARL